MAHLVIHQDDFALVIWAPITLMVQNQCYQNQIFS